MKADPSLKVTLPNQVQDLDIIEHALSQNDD
jgi:hypothetical protein